MQKVKIKKTGEILTVPNNEAHQLIESGKARLYTGYKTKEMRPKKKKDYKYSIK